MNYFFRFVSAIFTALLPFIGLNIVGLFIINDNPNLLGYSISALILVVSILISVWIHRRVMKMGVLQFISAVSASPDLNNPMPTENSDHKLRRPEEIAFLINQNKNLCLGGSLQFFGDFYKIHGEHFHKLVKSEYSAYDKKLTFHFDEGELVEIYRPNTITEGTTYLKIKEASRILFQFKIDGNPSFLDYRKSENEITLKGDNDELTKNTGASLSAPAFMMN